MTSRHRRSKTFVRVIRTCTISAFSSHGAEKAKFMNKILLCAAFAAMLLLAAGRPAEKGWAQDRQAQEKSAAKNGQGSGKGQAFKPLFNGKALSDWKHVGRGSMTVEDGLIRTHGGMGLLYWTGGKMGNCRIRVVFKMRDHNDNSGVFVRIPIEPREPWMPVHYGYEVQIDNEPETSQEDEYHVTGTLYSLTKPAARPGKPGPEWNTMLITLDGPHTVVVLNDVKVTDYTEGQPVPEKKFDFEPERGRRPNEGYMGLQNHSDNDIVFFKEVSVQPLR